MADESSIITGFQLGADDYITKPFKPMELICRVRNALRKSGKVPSVFQVKDLHIDATKGIVIKAGKELTLSALEYRLLLVFLNHFGETLSRSDEMQIQQGLRMIVYLFAGILTCIGLANIFASTMGQIHQRKREFARYFAVGLTPRGAAKILAWEAVIVALRPILLTIVVNIPLMAFMLDAGGITAGDFIAKRLPLVPAILLFATVIGFVALAYYLGGKKICNMNLVEAIKDDTLSM